MSTSLVAIATKFMPTHCSVHIIESPHGLAEHDELRSIYRHADYDSQSPDQKQNLS